MLLSGEVCIPTPFLLLTTFTFIIFICRRWKGIKDGRKKKKIPLDSNFNFKLTTILWWCRMFCWINRNSRLLETRRLKNIKELSFANYNLRVRHVCPCSVDMFDWGYCLLERHNALLSSRLCKHVRSQQAANRKRSLRSSGLGVTELESFSLVLESHSF